VPLSPCCCVFLIPCQSTGLRSLGARAGPPFFSLFSIPKPFPLLPLLEKEERVVRDQPEPERHWPSTSPCHHNTSFYSSGYFRGFLQQACPRVKVVWPGFLATLLVSCCVNLRLILSFAIPTGPAAQSTSPPFALPPAISKKKKHHHRILLSNNLSICDTTFAESPLLSRSAVLGRSRTRNNPICFLLPPSLRSS
jgi:hypothetical protein